MDFNFFLKNRCIGRRCQEFNRLRLNDKKIFGRYFNVRLRMDRRIRKQKIDEMSETLFVVIQSIADCDCHITFKHYNTNIAVHVFQSNVDSIIHS